MSLKDAAAAAHDADLRKKADEREHHREQLKLECNNYIYGIVGYHFTEFSSCGLSQVSGLVDGIRVTVKKSIRDDGTNHYKAFVGASDSYDAQFTDLKSLGKALKMYPQAIRTSHPDVN